MKTKTVSCPKGAKDSVKKGKGLFNPLGLTTVETIMRATETVIHAKVDKKSAKRAERVFAKLGMSTDQAINMFLAQVIERKGIPFTVTLGGTEDDGTFWSEKIREDSLAEVYGN